MKKNKKEIPVPYETEYYEFEQIDCEKEESDSEVSEMESDISDKNDQEIILKEVEEMNNNYSFVNFKKKKHDTKVKNNKDTIILTEETYLSD